MIAVMRSACSSDDAAPLAAPRRRDSAVGDQLARPATTLSGVPSSCATPDASWPTVREAVGVAQLLEGRDARLGLRGDLVARRGEPLAHAR